MIAVFVTFDSPDLDDAVGAQGRGRSQSDVPRHAEAAQQVLYARREAEAGEERLCLGERIGGSRVFSDELLERVTGLYGVRPNIEFA